MRNGRRKVLAALGMFLLGTLRAAVAAPPPEPAAGVTGESPVRLTVDLSWTFPAGTALATDDTPALTLEMTAGKIVDAIAWPDANDPRAKPHREAGGAWALGASGAGHVRARVEGPLGAVFLFRAQGQELRFPLAAVLEGRQHTPPQAPVEIALERLAWDTLTLATTASGPDNEAVDGTVAPGATIPVPMGLNILTPEPAEMTVYCSAELRPWRGGDVVWRAERQEIVPTNRVEVPARPWMLTAPRTEGTYVLEFRATWEPVTPARRSSVLSRLIRPRRAAVAASTATRRVTLAVVRRDAAKDKDPAPAAKAEREVDSVDLARPRSRLIASGRAPAEPAAGWLVPDAALVEPTRRDRLRGWILRGGPDAANLGASAGAGLAWSALGLKVAHPGKPHRLTVKVTGGHPAALGVALLDPGPPGRRPRVALDACASGPPVPPDGAPQAFSWLVWPDAAEPVVVLVNRGAETPVQLGSIALTELADVPAAQAVAEREARPRGFGLYVAGPGALERFGAGDDAATGDVLTQAQRLARYAAYCGATSVVAPEALADRARRQALDGQGAEDAFGPDRLDVLLRVLGRRGLNAWLELDLAGPLPGLPAPAAPEALARGLVRVDGRGQADGPDYHPLHPDVRAALRGRVTAALAAHRETVCLRGVLVRLGRGPTLLGGAATGLDDSTYERFAHEMFDGMTADNMPGLGTDAADRFAQRAQFVTGPGRTPWLTWRARAIASLYGELAAAAREAAPEATLMVATPGLDDGPAGAEARLADQAGLAPSLAWRNVGLDFDVWPTGTDAPLVLRGVEPADDGLARDLSLSPELDAKVAACPERGLILAPAVSASPAPPHGARVKLTAAPADAERAVDEPLGHALAALDARQVVLSTEAATGVEARLRQFAQVFRALPTPPPGPAAGGRDRSGVAVRALPAGRNTYLALANDTPYPILVETVLPALGTAEVDDLGRGLRLAPKSERGTSHLVLDMPPFGVSVVRVGAPAAKVESVATYPSDAVRAGMLAQYNALTALLARLNQGGDGASGPPNPSFEPATEGPVVPLSHNAGALPAPGWQLVEGMSMPGANSLALDPAQAHAGQSSLRLSATGPPASAVSDPFTPRVQTSLTVTAWFRAAAPDTKLRLWIEGEAAGQPFQRRSELTLQPEWGAQAVRASNLPAGGLDSVRLRFELPAAGTVWVDELNVAGESLTDTERTYARRALMAALLAHREQRWADFARLAGSHWAQRPAALWGEPAAIARGGGNALPSDRRLR